MKALIKIRLGTWSSLALGMMFAGCATTRYAPQPLSAAATTEELQGRDLNGSRLQEFFLETDPDLARLWPRESWDLDALTLAAFFYHPDLDVARAQFAETVASIRTAGARPNPSLTLTPGFNFSAAMDSSPWFPGVDFDWPIETAGKRGIRITRAEAQAEAARLNVTSVAWRLRSEVRGALVDLTASEQRLTLLHSQEEVLLRIVQLLQDRQTFGAASTQEVAAARIALSRMEMEVADAERQRAEALSQLAESLGVPLSAVQALTIDFPPSETVSVPSTNARQLALLDRADINASLADYAANEADLQSEIAKQYPDVDIGSGFEWDQGETKWSVGVGLELPVFNRNLGPIAEAEARRSESAAVFRALQAKVIAAIDRAVSDRALSDEQLRRAREAQGAADEQASIMQARLAEGDVDQLEYQNARLESLVSALALLEAEIAAARSTGELEDALQIPIPAIAAVSLRANSTSVIK